MSTPVAYAIFCIQKKDVSWFFFAVYKPIGTEKYYIFFLLSLNNCINLRATSSILKNLKS